MGLHKIYNYIYFLNRFKHFFSNRSSTGRRKKILTTGNILFLGIVAILLIFFFITAIADLFNILQPSQWPGVGWSYSMDIPIADLVWGGAQQLINAVLNITPQGILSFGELTLSTIGVIILALLDEVLGIGILTIAFIARIINQFFRPMATLSWLLLFASLIPSAISH
ncbi:MAG: hypothetical protein PHO01_12020 [Desulfotomaculaceae bacterium]|nr:hypothetical protein [Desulfotomaculaceae bacterium]